MLGTPELIYKKTNLMGFFQFKPGDVEGTPRRTFKMNVHHRFTHLRVIAPTPDSTEAKSSFLPCAVYCKNHPDEQKRYWRWLYLYTRETTIRKMAVTGPNANYRSNTMRRIFLSTLVRLLGKITYETNEHDGKRFPRFTVPYTAMEATVQQLVKDEAESTTADKEEVLQIIRLWSRLLWQSIVNLVHPIMTCRNWDGSASAAGSGLLTLISAICMHANVQHQDLTPENLAKWPIGVDVAGAPKGHPLNCNIEYMVADAELLTCENMLDIQDEVKIVFDSQAVRPTKAFTPDFVLSAGGAVLLTGDGKSPEHDKYEGDEVICLVANRQFAYQDLGLALTSTNNRFRLSVLTNGTYSVEDTHRENFEFPGVRVEHFESSQFNLDPQFRDHPKSTTEIDLLSASADAVWKTLGIEFRCYARAISETMDRLLVHFIPHLTLQNVIDIQTKYAASCQITPLPHFIQDRAPTVCPDQEIWHIDRFCIAKWLSKNLVDYLGSGSDDPPPPPPSGGPGGSSGSQPPPPRPPSTQQGGKSSKRPAASPSASTAKKPKSTPKSVVALIDHYNQLHAQGSSAAWVAHLKQLWEQRISYYDLDFGETENSPSEIVALAMNSCQGESLTALSNVRGARLANNSEMHHLMTTFLSEFQFSNPAYNTFVQFTFGLRKLT